VCLFKRNNAAYFLGLYGWIAHHFSLKMSRLVLICGPITAIMCAIWCGFVLDFILEPFLLILGKKYPADDKLFAISNGDKAEDKPEEKKPAATKGKKEEKKSSKKNNTVKRLKKEEDFTLMEWDEEYRKGGAAQAKRKAKLEVFNLLPEDVWDSFCSFRDTWKRNSMFHLGRIALSLVLIFYFLVLSSWGRTTAEFLNYCDRTAQQMSSPTILKMVHMGGKPTIIDDALQGYKWLETKTPKDSRVFAWWDYGYQITGIGKRTSLADGNTWNHEHIATLGRLLSGGQKSSHGVIRHLADYVLIMTGAVNDDLGISTHFARIGNSVFPDHCGDDDPACTRYNFHGGDRYQPTSMMKKSLVYNLYMHGPQSSKAGANPALFELAWKSSNDQMRFFKVLNVSEESKEWVKNPENKICDAPGSWYCVGQYPPAIKGFLNKRRSFSQVEDFNKKGEKSAYTKMIEKERAGGKAADL
jgi:dolichyl-diphosphooligosaccharide--protein glycosyltransferase